MCGCVWFVCVYVCVYVCMNLQLYDYITSRMNVLAPNLCVLIGPDVAARLMALVGGLPNLANIPSSNLLVRPPMCPAWKGGTEHSDTHAYTHQHSDTHANTHQHSDTQANTHTHTHTLTLTHTHSHTHTHTRGISVLHTRNVYISEMHE